MRRLIVPLGMMGIMACVSEQPSPQPVSVVGMFSDMRYHEDGGDVLGMEVFIVWGGDRWYATVQCAGGEPRPPVVVPVSGEELHVAFTLPQGLPECGTKFSGVVAPEGLRGRFEGEEGERWLPRKASYWQQ